MQHEGDIRVFGVIGIPEVAPGDDLPALILTALNHQGRSLASGDVVVVTQKVVSKAEGQLLDLATVTPSSFAHQQATEHDKDPRLIEVVLREAARIVRMDRGVIICQTRQGLICANAGIDRSNVPGDSTVTLLPRDPDASARQLQAAFGAAGADVAVVISDTFGRPWRLGQTNVAIGAAGISPLREYHGQTDVYGRSLLATSLAVIDALAATAELVMGKVKQVPVAVIRGYDYASGEGQGASVLVRAAAQDLFR
ncbi:MAG: coenzyme F420-0:L-glutamate ligase [Dehalococcoidia bacterium]|nr:coenzyme F420-0:L-glutamate ligase [Dehalococcoidia bacterium]